MNRKLLMIILFMVSSHSLQAGGKETLPAERDSAAYPKGYYSGDPLPEKTAYLTFDDGPTDWTDGILNVLQKENIKATFYISAYWNNRKRTGNPTFKKYKATLLRMVKEGHVLANHTADHKVLTKLSPDEIRDQFSRNQQLLENVLGKETPLMTILRPPLGYPWYKKSSRDTKVRVGGTLTEIGIVTLWSREYDTSDSWQWVHGEWYRKSARVDVNDPVFKQKVKKIHDRIISLTDGRGMVILMHDTHNTTLAALPSIITDLKARGYSFRTMEDYVLWKYGRGSRALTGKPLK